MGDDRLSWREIDKLRDRPGGRRKKEQRDFFQESTTRYQRYKAELEKLFDQGMTDELLRKLGKSSPTEKPPAASPEPQEKKSRKVKTEAVNRAASRLKLMRAVIDASTIEEVRRAIDELVSAFGIPDDLDVLVRFAEHEDEGLVRQAIEKLLELIPRTASVPKKASLKVRLRIISQTAKDSVLRSLAEKLTAML
jgi:plasmid replication initiation protein